MRVKKHMGLKLKLMLTFAVLTILPVGLNAVVAYIQTVNAIERQASNYTQIMTKQITNTLDTYLANADTLSIQAAYNDVVTEVLQKQYGKTQNPQYEYARDLRTMSRFLEGIRRSLNGLDNAYVYNSNFQYFNGYGIGMINDKYDIRQEDWYHKLDNSSGEKVLVGPYIGTQFDYARGPVISLVRKIMNISTMTPRGIILFEINLNDIFTQNLRYINTYDGGNIFILNEDAEIIYNNAEPSDLVIHFSGELFEQIKANRTASLWGDYMGEASLIVYQQCEFTDWKVVSVTPKRSLVQEADAIRNSSLMVCLLLIVFAMALATPISNSIVKPVRNLQASIHQIEQGNFEQRVHVERNDEIGQLTTAFNQMSTRLHDLIGQIYHESEQKRRAEIAMLQAQINPHFIYNSLNVIKQMSSLQGADGISAMVDSLVELLQASTKNIDRPITVSEELNLIRAYAYIQEMRYFGKFSLEIDCEEAALHCQTLNLLLQPIVENAIFHGIAAKSGDSRIRVTVRLSGDRLVYTVEDDGCGMSQSLIDEVLSRESRTGTHIGIHNVNKRIKLTFGECYGLSFSSELGMGTIVTISLPAVKSADT